MMMPHSRIQRDFTLARRARFERVPAGERLGTRLAPDQRPNRVAALRVQIGRALIGAGSRLSGEQVEPVRPPAHRPA